MHKSGIMCKISKVGLETFGTSKIENLALIEEELVCLTTTELHVSSIILEVAIWYVHFIYIYVYLDMKNPSILYSCIVTIPRN